MTSTGSPMTVNQMSSTNSKAVIVGFALVATGGLIGACGMMITGTAMFNAFRSWLQAQEEPPSAVMRRKISQARAATQAGASAWQNGMAATTSSPSQ